MVACESVCALAHHNSELVEIDECGPGTPYTLSGKLLNAWSLFKKPCHHMIFFFPLRRQCSSKKPEKEYLHVFVVCHNHARPVFSITFLPHFPHLSTHLPILIV